MKRWVIRIRLLDDYTQDEMRSLARSTIGNRTDWEYLSVETDEKGAHWRTIDGNEPTGDYVDPTTARVFRKSESGNWYIVRDGSARPAYPAGRIYGPIPIDRTEDS